MADSYIQFPPNSTGEKQRTLTETVASQAVHTPFFTFRQQPTYFIFAEGITPAVGRLITVLNRHASKVCRIWRANMYISTNTPVAGVLLRARIDRCTHTSALSGGTAVTPIQADTTDGALASGIDVMTRATNSITSVGGIKQFMLSSEEAVVTTLNANSEAGEAYPRDTYCLYKQDIAFAKPITLRPQGSVFEGFNIEGLSGTVGNLGLEILMTVDDQ